MQYSRNEIFVWLDKYEKISRFRYFVKKCAEDRQVAKPYEPWKPINRGAPLPSCIS